MENHTASSWNPNVKFPELRRPRTLLSNNTSNDSKENSTSAANTNVSDVAKNSKLSAEAEEWYPRGYCANLDVTEQFDSVNSSTESSNVPNPKPYSVQNRLTKYRQESNECNMEFLKNIIQTLTKSPGDFDDLIYDLLEFLSPYFIDIAVMSGVTSMIFQQALTEKNFQYSAVRLFSILDENCSLVRASLHSLCEKELENVASLQNVLLLFAEIYSKMNYELFGQSLLKALKKLKPNTDNVKNICQTLKLTGAKLEELDKPLLTELISQLDKIRSSLPPNMSFLVESVIKLRDNQWGQTDATSVVTVPPPVESSYEWCDGPIFYGPDGMQLTSEENDFLTDNLNDLIIDDNDPDGLWNPEPEMNEEIQAAFAEFVRTNTR